MLGNLDHLEAAVTVFRSVVARVPADQWNNPTCCNNWSARTVAEHVAWRLERLEKFADDSYSAHPDSTSNPLGADIAAEIEVIASRTIARLREPKALLRSAETRFGSLTLRHVVGHTWTESLIHAWDIATATGVDHHITHQLATDAYTTLFPVIEGVRTSGHYGPAIEADGDADMIDMLVALSGRDPSQDPAAGQRRPAPLDLHIPERMSPLEDTLDWMVDAIDRLNKVAGQVPPDSWDNETACSGWNARTVAGHCAASAERLASLVTGAELGALQENMELVGDNPAIELHQRMEYALDKIREPETFDDQISTELGVMTVAEALGLLWIELTIHTWDIADATYVDHGIDDVTAALAFSQLHQVLDTLEAAGYYREPAEPTERTLVSTLIARTGRTSVRALVTL